MRDVAPRQLDIVAHADFVRLDAARRLDEDRQAELGQFLTPAPVARFMASLVRSRDRIQLLEPGAGTGSLVAAVVADLCRRSDRPSSIDVVAYEIDPLLVEYLEDTLRMCSALCADFGVGFNGEVRQQDFLQDAAERLTRAPLFDPDGPDRFNGVVLNPPYGKIRSDSEHRRLLRAIGVETGNVYTGFLAAAAEFLEDDGDLVAITPRSFCNGPYFRPFREFFLRRMAFRRLHVFESRSQAFRDDDVLQENVIFHAVRGAEPGEVTVSTGVGPDDGSISERTIRYEQLVWPEDPEAFIHIVPQETGQRVADAMGHVRGTLDDLALTASTGRVVDFRAKRFLRADPEPGTVPLIYPAHLRDGYVSWPRETRKPNAIVDAGDTQDLLVPRGTYVLTKRFTAKEERRRVVAAVFDPERVPAERVGFENHLNYFHRDGRGLDPAMARGLAAYLNSTLVDTFFRQFSGHTQVNATDLRSLPYPTRAQLKELGARVGNTFPDQQELDALVDDVLFNTSEGGKSPVPGNRRIQDAISILRAVGLPRQQQNDRSGLTLLALLELGPEALWSEAAAPVVRIHDILTFAAEQYDVEYAENTRETIRRQTMHQFVDAGIASKNPDDPTRPVNSPKTVYQVDPDVLALVRTYGAYTWKKNLEDYLGGVETLRERYAKRRDIEVVPIEVANGQKIELTPGEHNDLIRAVVEKFAGRFTPGGRLLYVGDTGKKFAYFDEEAMGALGVEVDPHGKMPDAIIHEPERGWLVLLEAVTSHGPINPKRHGELERLFADAAAGLVFVTAFPDRATMAKYLADISWETEVWVADAPDHLIHFDGERFLGPYESKL